MKSGESVQDYLTRAAAVVNQMKSYGEQVTDQTTVEKVLQSLTQKFDHVVAAIEESKDLATYSFDELQGSLQSHEARLNRTNEEFDEKAFQVMGESSKQQGIKSLFKELDESYKVKVMTRRCKLRAKALWR
ncbi:uncharacterized protein LOC105784644 [Gossypium raimondii]|uniref:uncharacterized protein LOC105784644 n=1 Tax=Gossypium raimondii TaxID=29730 RepID=UPI00063A94FC|nr:uncharacterized protein LOC105784644 [Gossypium raimondii]